MKFNKAIVYTSSNDFFELDGSVSMKLDAYAAQNVCIEAIKYELVVVKIEGGIWHTPWFEARLDCIWNGIDPPISKSKAIINNAKALDMIYKESECDTFIITVAPLAGYKHRQSI